VRGRGLGAGPSFSERDVSDDKEATEFGGEGEGEGVGEGGGETASNVVSEGGIPSWACAFSSQ
jgi:hypothetical protein